MKEMYISIVIIELVLLAITIADAATNRMIPGRMKKGAVTACLIIAAAGLGEAIGTLTDGGPESTYYLHKYAKLAEFCFAPMTGVAVAASISRDSKPLFAFALVGIHGAFELAAVPFNLGNL